MTVVETWKISEIEEVVDLVNRASPEDRFDLDSVRDAIADDPDHDPNLLLCVREGGKIVGVIAAEIRRPRGGSRNARAGHVKLLAVDPACQRRGIGGALLDQVERQFIDDGVKSSRIFADDPTYLRPGVDFRITSLMCFLLRRGYESARPVVNMDVDLTRADLDTSVDEARLKRLGIEVRRLAATDAEAFEAYLGREWSWGWQFESMTTLKRTPISTHLALRDDRIVGFSCHSTMGPAQFGPMGVRPDERRTGIGAVLLKRCLADLRDEGQAHADVQWVGPITFYQRHAGATLSRAFWQFQRELGTG
ncbi:MAG TPA: GNAT family N-acetyltransferase [Chloroflexota bacterium]|nr:GNAT family N-acetyltransferase [Chloroflexota bacterium]